jgi:hypothetical protein
MRAWRRHLLRAIGEEINDLGRPVDLARSRALLLAALGLALAALLGAGVSVAEYTSAQRQARATAAHLHQVDAVLLAQARRTASATGPGRTDYRAEAAWTYPPGHDSTGTVEVTGKGDPGSSTRIWVSDQGRLAAGPPSTADITGDAVCLGLFTLGGLSVVLGAGLGRRLRTLDRRADRAWQRSWAQLEPVWSGRDARRPGVDDSRPGADESRPGRAGQ